MSEASTDPAAPGTEAAAGAAGEQVNQEPPWGSAEEFNPEKAWSLIQNLRGDVQAAKTKAAESDELRARVKEFEDAKLSAEERATRDLAEAQKAATDLGLENAKLKAAIEHGLTADDIDFIGGSTPEEIADKAAKFAARLGSGAPTTPPSARPNSGLRGGGDPTVPVETKDWLRDALSRTS